ncbi:hypothetical protein GBAR_LOCUS25001, partial [Geodia barretti]
KIQRSPSTLPEIHRLTSLSVCQEDTFLSLRGYYRSQHFYSCSACRSRNYAIRTYYVPNPLNVQRSFILLVTQSKDLVVKIVHEILRERSSRRSKYIAFKFKPGVTKITLDTPKEPWTKDGWRLCPLSSLRVRD